MYTMESFFINKMILLFMNRVELFKKQRKWLRITFDVPICCFMWWADKIKLLQVEATSDNAIFIFYGKCGNNETI